MSRSPLRFANAAIAATVVLTGLHLDAQAPTEKPAQTSRVNILPIRGNIYMLVGPAGGNATVSIGPEGVLIVDTMTADLASDIISAIRTLSPAPIRWILNTHSHKDHTGGNATLATAGKYIAGGNTRGGSGASIVAYETSLMRSNGSAESGDALPSEGWPTDSFFVKQKDMFFNGEPVLLMHRPSAHTDGDSLVFFRRSDVIAAGDLFTPDRYPVIDLSQNGSINGTIAGLNYILELAVPEFNEEGGTMVVPGHGRLSDESDVGDYRDMVTVVRDRVQNLVSKKMTLEQVKAARLTMDYDGVYGRPDYTGDMFVEAVYKSLTAAAATKSTTPGRAR